VGTEPPYTSPEHPIQKDILTVFADMCDLAEDQVSVGIDGCSVPTFAVPLYHAALAFARLCDPDQKDKRRAEACLTITSAMTTHPDMVGGPDSFDTHLMTAAQGQILCKGGAEGYQALGILPGARGKGSPALGIAIKISDGDLGSHAGSSGAPSGHARPAVALAVLLQLGILKPTELGSLGEYGPRFPIQNWRKLSVGEARTCLSLDFNNS